MRREVAVVIGGSSGIGRASALELARQGCVVVAAGLGSDLLADLNKEIQTGGGECVTIAGDLRDPDLVTNVFAVAAEYGIGVRRVVNAVGIQRYATTEETSDALLAEVLETNFVIAFRASRAAIPHLRAAGGGAIVTVSSVQGHATQERVAAYSATKAALHSLTRSIAVDHAREGIRAVSVSPGSVDTPMLRAAADLFAPDAPIEDVLAEWGSIHPLGRVATADEVAKVVAFASGPDASFVTGCDIRVDGGLLAKIAVDPPAKS